MAYTIINSYIPTTLYPLKAPYTMVPESITIHNTANDATAANEIAYLKNNSAATSYHVAVDDKQVIQAIPFTRNAFAAGDGATGKGNRSSIHIEICYSKSGGSKYTAAEANAIEYVAHLLKQYGWGIDRVKWHKDWPRPTDGYRKNCPHRILDEGRAQSVKDRIAAKLKELNAPKKEEVKVANVEYEKDAKVGPALAKEFELAKKAGITDGTYPNRPGTRAEMAVMIYRATKSKD